MRRSGERRENEEEKEGMEKQLVGRTTRRHAFLSASNRFRVNRTMSLSQTKAGLTNERACL